MKKLLAKTALVPRFFTLAQVGIGMTVFWLLLVIPPPPFISGIFHLPKWQTLVVLFLFFALVLSRNGKGWETPQITLMFGLFAISLIYKWQYAYNDGEIIGGLLPWSDASGYYGAASRLVSGLLIIDWGAHRPLFISLLAVVLRLSGGDFMVTLILLTFMNVIAVVMAIQAVKRWYGAVGAAVYLLIGYEFYERFAGKAMTEQLGFALGNLALFFLLVGVQSRSFWRTLFGLGLLTFALIARAGAFFILPALILWTAYYFRRQVVFWRSVGLAVVVVMAAFILNNFLARITAGRHQGAIFSNYSYTLYGLASGNKGWYQIIFDHPNIAKEEIMPRAIQKIREDPGMLLYGIQESYKDYFKPYRGAFSFIVLGADQVKANIVFWGVVLIGLIYSWFTRGTGTGGLVLTSFLGVFASLGLLPPIDADSMRAFAATIPFTALWVAAGISAVFTWAGKRLIKKESDPTEEMGMPFQKLALGFSVLIITLAVPAPLLLRIFPVKSSTSLSQPACGSAEELLQVVVFENTSIILIEDDVARESYMPFIRISDFHSFTPNGQYPFLEEELLSLRPTNRITYGLMFDYENQSDSLYMVSNFPVKDGKFSICGHAADNKQLRTYGFYDLNGPKNHFSSLTFSQRNPTVTLVVRLLYGLGLGFVILILAMDVFGFQLNSVVNYLCVTGVLFLVVQGVLMYLYVQGKLSIPFSEQRLTLQGKDAIPEQGYLYTLALGTTWMNQNDLGISPALIYENGVPLAWPNSSHQEIWEKGNGRYSVWNGSLYFSTSDNSDPRTNGRIYEIEWPRPIPPILQWVSYLVGIGGVLVVLWSIAYNEKHRFPIAIVDL